VTRVTIPPIYAGLILSVFTLWSSLVLFFTVITFLISLSIHLFVLTHDLAIAIEVFPIVTPFTNTLFPHMMLSLAGLGRRVKN
jgi:hypothetical protein